MGLEQSELQKNSPLRVLTEDVRFGVARFLHRTFPDLTADDVTHLGTRGTMIGVVVNVGLNLLSPKEKITLNRFLLGIGLTGIPQAADAIDGPLAAIIKREKDIKARERGEELSPQALLERKIHGGLEDFGADRKQEIALGLGRAVDAYFRGDLGGEVLAYAAVLTNPLTSLTRAMAEERGRVVKEMGFGIDLLGNRVGRAGLGIIGISYPPLQRLLDSISIVSNILSASRRFNIAISDNDRDTLTPDKRRELMVLAERRLPLADDLMNLAVRGVILTLVGLRLGSMIGLFKRRPNY